MWDGNSVSISSQIFTVGPWYLHVAAYAGGNTPDTDPLTSHYGPYLIFTGAGDSPTLLSEVQSSTTVQWLLRRAVGDNFNVGDPNYGFQMPNQPDITWLPLDSQDGTFLTQSSSFTANLTPNTTYNMLGYLRDSNGVIAGPVTAAATTYQSTPLGVGVQLSETQLTMSALGTFFNLAVGLTGFEFRAVDTESSLSRVFTTTDTVAVLQPLTANRQYSLSVRAENMVGVWTDLTPNVLVTALARPPSDQVIQPDTDDLDQPLFTAGSCYLEGKRFTFVNQGGWDGVFAYKVLVDNQSDTPALDAFDGPDAISWTALKFSTTPVQDGRYYVHFRSYNNDNVGGPTVYTYGPLIIDGTPPLLPVLQSVAVSSVSMTWIAEPVIDNPNGCGADRPDSLNFRVNMPDSRWEGTEHDALGLSPNTEYDVNLAARDNVGNTTVAVAYSSYTLAAIPSGRPDELNVDLTGATLSWFTNFNSSVTVYEMGASFTPDMANPVVTVAGVDVESGTISGLRANTLYYFAVRARNFYGIATDWSFAGSSTTANNLIAPAITTLQTSSTSIQMGWIDFGPTGISFDVLDNTGATLTLPGQPQAPNGDHVNNFSSLTPNTTYSLGVRSNIINNGTTFVSDYVATMTVTLAETPTAGQFAVFTDSATMNWIDGPASVPLTTLYEAKAALSADALDGVGVSQLVQNNNVVLTGLTPDTSYYFVVRAINQAGVPNDWVPFGGGVAANRGAATSVSF